MTPLNKVYKTDKKKKKFIKKTAFKKTYKWRQLKPKRIKGLMFLLSAFILPFSLIILPYEWLDYSGPIMGIVAGFLSFVGATMIKEVYTDTRMVDSRFNEEIRLSGQYLEYRYELPAGKGGLQSKQPINIVVIPYDGIENMLYSTYLHKLILECYYTTRKEKKSSGGSQLSHIFDFERSELEILEIPMYFENEDDFLLRLGLLSNREIVVIETEMEKTI